MFQRDNSNKVTGLHCRYKLIYLAFVKKKRKGKEKLSVLGKGVIRNKLGEYTQGKILVTILIEHNN